MRLQGSPTGSVTAFVESTEGGGRVHRQISSCWRLPASSTPGRHAALLRHQPNCYSADAFDADSTCGGIGPYKITKWERRVEMVLEANEGYYGTPPKSSKVIHQVLRRCDDNAAGGGERRDRCRHQDPQPDRLCDLPGGRQAAGDPGPGAQIRYICFNNTTPPFDSEGGTPQAISYLVDRDAVTTVAFQGTHEPLYTMVPIGMWSHLDSFPKRDVAKARRAADRSRLHRRQTLVMDFWWTPTHYGRPKPT